MSESDAETDDTDEVTEEETDEPAETETPDSSGGDGSGGGSGLEDFVSEAEQEILKDWLIYVTGLFAVVGLAVGLDANIQDQWSHTLFSTSGPGAGAGLGPAITYAGIVSVGIIALTLFGAVVARNVDNSENTAFKVAAATSLIAMPILYIVAGFTMLIPFDNVSLEFVNAIVSGLGSGIAAAICASIVVWLTENQSPDGLGS